MCGLLFGLSSFNAGFIWGFGLGRRVRFLLCVFWFEESYAVR